MLESESVLICPVTIPQKRKTGQEIKNRIFQIQKQRLARQDTAAFFELRLLKYCSEKRV